MANQITSPSLEVSTNTDHHKQVYPLTPAKYQVFGIGRDPSNAIVINRPTVSSFHAQIVRDGNQLCPIHPHPSRDHTVNGLTYEGKTIHGNEPFRHVLSRGDIFRISDENGTFVTLTYNDGSGMTQDIIPEIHPIPLGAPLITIGRALDNTVVLNHPQVSGHHARLEQVRGGYRIIDTGSTNRVYVNAERVHTHNLKLGDELQAQARRPIAADCQRHPGRTDVTRMRVVPNVDFVTLADLDRLRDATPVEKRAVAALEILKVHETLVAFKPGVAAADLGVVQDDFGALVAPELQRRASSKRTACATLADVEI